MRVDELSSTLLFIVAHSIYLTHSLAHSQCNIINYDGKHKGECTMSGGSCNRTKEGEVELISRWPDPILYLHTILFEKERNLFHRFGPLSAGPIDSKAPRRAYFISSALWTH